jgi:hypothetical protein
VNPPGYYEKFKAVSAKYEKAKAVIHNLEVEIAHLKLSHHHEKKGRPSIVHHAIDHLKVDAAGSEHDNRPKTASGRYITNLKNYMSKKGTHDHAEPTNETEEPPIDMRPRSGSQLASQGIHKTGSDEI